MSLVTEHYFMDVLEPGFVHIQYSSIDKTRYGVGETKSPLWFERANLRWVVDTLRVFRTGSLFETSIFAGGQDSLRIAERGPEHEPIIVLQNRRPRDVVHGGDYSVSMTKKLARKLEGELAGLDHDS